MQILMISGFLGAGKTSFIQAMAKATGRQYVIVENEFGPVGIDGPILEASAQENGLDQMKIWELTEGCICCSTNLDFTHSVLTIANTLAPDYLIIEPSGVALPGRIIDKLKNICYEQIGLLAPVTMIDAVHYQKSRTDFPEYFANQIQHGQVIVLSKSEHWSRQDFLAAKKDLGITPEQDFPLEHYSQWDKKQWDDLFMKEIVWENPKTQAKPTPSIGSISLNRANKSRRLTYQIKKRQIETPKNNMETIAFSDCELDSADTLYQILYILTLGLYGQIVRGKGFCKTPTGYLRFDLVDGQFSILGEDYPSDPSIVFIGTNLQRESIDRILHNQEISFSPISVSRSDDLTFEESHM